MPIKKITGTIESILTQAVQSKENPFKNMITDLFTDIKNGKINNTEDVKEDVKRDLPRTNFVSAEKSYDDIFEDWAQRDEFSFSQGDFTGEFLTSTFKLVSFGASERPCKGMAFCYADSHDYSGVSLIVFTDTGENLNEWILAVTHNNFTSATLEINATLYQHSCLLDEDVNTLTNLDSICQEINSEDIAALIKILLVPQKNETVVNHSVLDALNEKFDVKAIAHSPRDILKYARVSALKDNQVASGAGETQYHQNRQNPTTREPLLSGRYQQGSLNRTRCRRSNARLMACLFIFPVVIMALLNNENHHLDDKIQPWLESVHQPWERGAIVGSLIGSGLVLMVGGILQISQQCHRKPSSNQSSSEAQRRNHPLNQMV